MLKRQVTMPKHLCPTAWAQSIEQQPTVEQAGVPTSPLPPNAKRCMAARPTALQPLRICRCSGDSPSLFHVSCWTHLSVPQGSHVGKGCVVAQPLQEF